MRRAFCILLIFQAFSLFISCDKKAIAQLASMQKDGDMEALTTVKINETSFLDCTSLQAITLSKSFLRMKAYAFKNYTSLKTISMPQNLMHAYFESYIEAGAYNSVGALVNCSKLTKYSNNAMRALG